MQVSPARRVSFDGADLQSDEQLLSLFLGRLRRLLQQRVERSAALNTDGIRLLDHAIFSTYCDCRTLGGEVMAQGLISAELRRLASERAPAMNL